MAQHLGKDFLMKGAVKVMEGTRERITRRTKKQIREDEKIAKKEAMCIDPRASEIERILENSRKELEDEGELIRD